MYKRATIAERFGHRIQDDVLRLLYEFHNNIFNPRDIPLSLESLSDAIGFDKSEVKEMCEGLVENFLIKKIPFLSGPFYKITETGIAHIEKKQPKRYRTITSLR